MKLLAGTGTRLADGPGGAGVARFGPGRRRHRLLVGRHRHAGGFAVCRASPCRRPARGRLITRPEPSDSGLFPARAGPPVGAEAASKHSNARVQCAAYPRPARRCRPLRLPRFDRRSDQDLRPDRRFRLGSDPDAGDLCRCVRRRHGLVATGNRSRPADLAMVRSAVADPSGGDGGQPAHPWSGWPANPSRLFC